MKFLLIFTVCVSYFLVSCAGLRCYEANNIDHYSSNATIEECTEPTVFCATVTFRNGQVPWNTCGDEEFCASSACYNYEFCKEPGTFEHDYPRLENVKVTITCCDTDLCNGESSAKTSNRISFPSFICMSVFVYYYFMTF